MADEEYTALTRREIAASGIGSDPKAIAAWESIQQAAFAANPQAAAQAAQQAAQANTAASGAQSTADDALFDANAALALADDALEAVAGKVTKSAGPAWAAPTGPASRAALAGYAAPAISNPPTQAEVQSLADAVAALSAALVAAITDLRSNQALTP